MMCLMEKSLLNTYLFGVSVFEILSEVLGLAKQNSHWSPYLGSILWADLSVCAHVCVCN